MRDHIRRREFITLLGGAAASPRAARAQQETTVRRVSVLTGNPSTDPNGPVYGYTIRQELASLGWVEGRNLRIDQRSAQDDAVRLKNHARDLIALAPDVILTTHTTAAQTMREATRTIPIVFASVSDPLENGLVADLARPDANITGVMLYEHSLVEKWLSLLKGMAPQLTRVALLYGSDAAAPWAPSYVRAAQQEGERLALKIVAADLRVAADIEPVVAAMAASDDGGLLVLPDVFNASHRATMITHAFKYGVPVIYPTRFYAIGGGLISYGPKLNLQFRNAATYVDRILRGAKPADLPVQFATKFELVINLKTAKALGLDVSQQLQSIADEVIE
jgi:putative tryptophan/tyrosine transport system substrate-binding protein